LLRRLYVPKSPNVNRENFYDLVIAAEYAGFNQEENILPDASKKCLRLAASLFTRKLAFEIAYGNSEGPGPGVAMLQEAKLVLLQECGVHSYDRVVSVVSNNTIQEVEGIYNVRPKAKWILIICDGPHARRYRRLIKYFYREAKVDVMTIRGKWNESHPSPWQQSAFRWWMMNLTYHCLMLVLGMPRFIRLFRHKTHVN
jgi:hypothetical protein